ncbi:hypothetical protein BJ878DRAFT_387331, partial [Calycina marina]
TEEILRNSIKPLSWRITIHPIIDACAQLHEQVKGRLGEIEKVHVRVQSLVLEVTGQKTPEDGLLAKFSVFHGGTCGLVFGKATPIQYEYDVVLSEEVITVRHNIVAEERSLGTDATVAVATFNDGTTVEMNVVHALGSTEEHLHDRKLQEKYMDL